MILTGILYKATKMSRYWIVHRYIRNDDESIRTYYRSSSDKEEAINEMIGIIKGCRTIKEKSIDIVKDEGRYFKWEWKRRGNYDAFYIVEGTDNSVKDSVDIGNFESDDDDSEED